jgi:two-component system chemotaxis response regulator CheB
MGAADTLLKPRPGGFNEEYRSQLLGKIRALGARNADPGASEAAATATAAPQHSFARPGAALRPRRLDAIAIGASTGGIHALGLMLGQIGPACDVPILITQHLPGSFIPVFARQVENACGRPADIAADGMVIRPGRVMIAPGHGHLLVRRSGERLVARICAEPAPSGCLPSVDPMLASLAEACEGRVLGVILSGMGRDGVVGAAELVEAGGTIFAQDAESSAVWGMPGAVAKAGLASLIATPARIGEAIMAHAGTAPVLRQGQGGS